MKKTTTILFLLLFGFQVFSQNSTITLLNKNTQQIIEQANVHWQLVEYPHKEGYVVADFNGKIKIPLQKGSKIILQSTCIGFKHFQDTIILQENQKLYMDEDVLNIEQVTVTGTRTPHVLKKAPVLTQMVTQDELKGVDAPTITDVLEIEMPGMEMSSHGGVPVMNMMGLETQYSLILIDGERMAKTLHKTIDFSRINTANIERIEIIRGASSALYGSDAMGGVINIITKGAKKKINVSADIKYQQNNSTDHTQQDIDNMEDAYAKQYYRNIDKPNLNANLSVGLRHKGFSSSSFFNYKMIDAYQLYDSKSLIRYYKNGDVIKQPLNTTAMTINGSQDFSVNQKFGYKNKKINCSLSGNYYNHHEYDFSNDKFHNLYKSYNGTSKNSYTINDNSVITLSNSFDKYQRFDYNEKKLTAKKTHDNVYNSTKLNYTYLLGKHSLFAEVENLHQLLTADKFEADKMKTKTTNDIVGVLQDEYSVLDQLTLVGGMRLGYHSTFKMHFTPSITAKYVLNNKLNFRLSYSRGFRAPDVKELFMNWSHLGMFQLKGNQDLKPETNNYYALSTDFLDVAHNLNVTVIASYNDVRNKIDGLWKDNETVFQYVNFAEAQIYSVETLVKWQFIKNFKLKAGYIFLHSKKSTDAQDLSSMSPMSATGQLEYKLTKNKYRLIANISGKITGKKEFDVLNSSKGSLYEGQYYQVRYPTFSIWNLSVTQYYDNFKLGFGVKNLFDYTAPIVTFNSTNSIGRRFYVSLGYRF